MRKGSGSSEDAFLKRMERARNSRKAS
jgi:hypothetical protein